MKNPNCSSLPRRPAAPRGVVGEGEQAEARACFPQRTSGVSAPNSASFPIRQPKGQHRNPLHRSSSLLEDHNTLNLRNRKEGRERISFLRSPPFLGKSQRQNFSVLSLVITTCEAMSKSNVRPSTPQLSLCFQKAAREDITISCEMRYSISCKMQLTFQASQCYCSSANVASK